MAEKWLNNPATIRNCDLTELLSVVRPRNEEEEAEDDYCS